MILKIMTDRYGFSKAIDEVREEWLENLLLYLGVNIHNLQEMSRPDFLEYLVEQNIDIVEYLGMGALQVKHNNEVVGEWGEPQLTLKKDKKEGGYYYEVEIENWSIMEEDIVL